MKPDKIITYYPATQLLVLSMYSSYQLQCSVVFLLSVIQSQRFSDFSFHRKQRDRSSLRSEAETMGEIFRLVSFLQHCSAIYTTVHYVANIIFHHRQYNFLLCYAHYTFHWWVWYRQKTHLKPNCIVLFNSMFCYCEVLKSITRTLFNIFRYSKVPQQNPVPKIPTWLAFFKNPGFLNPVP